MSREPHGGTAPQRNNMPRRGAPYQQQQQQLFQQPSPQSQLHRRPLSVAVTSVDNGNMSSSVGQTEISSTNRGPRRLTFNNFATFNPREKKLPPDANVQAALNAKLWQLPERASFYCNKCRRDNIISDSIAVDAAHQVMLCMRCFTRIIRPRSYRPSRVVPFPSLLSWLNYTPSKVMEVSSDIASRPAEAVAPSGERVISAVTFSSGSGGGSRPPQLVQSQPASGARTLPAPPPQPQSQPRVSVASTHPCRRVWGECRHGATCLFRGAPHDLCLAFLMGLCAGEGAEATCPLLHQRVFDLPSATDPAPARVRHKGEVENLESGWGRWVERRRQSPNSAEWQLWNNGPITELLNAYIPIAPSEAEIEAEKKKNVEDEHVEKDENGEKEVKSAVKLNFADISAALRGLKK